MLRNWQFNILFFVGVGGAVFIFLGPYLGLKIIDNPATYTGVGAILTYILAQKRVQIYKNGEKNERDRKHRGVDDDGLD